MAAVSLVLGLVALGLAETAAAEVLLAVFMGSILVVWAVELMDHQGILPGHRVDGPWRCRTFDPKGNRRWQGD